MNILFIYLFLYDVNIFKFFNEHTKKILGTAMVLNHRLYLYIFSLKSVTLKCLHLYCHGR